MQMPLPKTNSSDLAEVVLASGHAHWSSFGAQHEGHHFLSLETPSKNDGERVALLTEVLAQLRSLAYHRARQAVLRFVSDLRSIPQSELHKHRPMVEAAVQMRDRPNKTRYMETLRKSLDSIPEHRQMLAILAVAGDAALSGDPNPVETSIYSAFRAGRDQALETLKIRRDRCKGADIMLSRASVDEAIFLLPPADGPKLTSKAEQAISRMVLTIAQRDEDGPLIDDLMADLQELCACASDAAGDWTGQFLASLSDATPADLKRQRKLARTARLVRDDPASLDYFKPLLKALDEVRATQIRSAEALRMFGYNSVSKTFSSRPPILTTIIDAFKSARDFNIRAEREETPLSTGLAFMEMASQGEADIVVQQPKERYFGPSIGLKGTSRPNPTKLEHLGPFYQFVAKDISERIAPALAAMELRPVVDSDDPEKGVRVRFATRDGKGYGAVDIHFDGPENSTLSHATWRNASFDSLYNARRDVGTNGWFAIHTPEPDGSEIGDFDCNDDEAIDFVVETIMERDLLWDDDRLIPQQVRSELLADAWDHLDSHFMMTDGVHCVVSRDRKGTEHLKFRDAIGYSHVISLTKNDTWIMKSRGKVVADTSDWDVVEEAIDDHVADDVDWEPISYR